MIPAMFTTFFYYGVMQIAIDVENPFNFADVDHCVQIKFYGAFDLHAIDATSTGVVSMRRGRGWFSFDFEAVRTQVDHDLDSFSKRLHDETLVVAREVAPPGTRCRDYWITERKFAARNGSKRKKKKRTGEGYFKQVSEKLVTYHDEL